MNNLRLWRLSKYVQFENILQTQIANGGNQREGLMERYNKNIQGIQKNTRINSVFIAAFLIIPAIIPYNTINQLKAINPTTNVQLILFSSSISFATYYIFNFIFILIFGMLYFANLMKGDIFQYLYTLPFSNSDVKKIVVFTFVRLLLYQYIVMLLLLPIIIGWLTRSLLFVLIVFIINILNLILITYLLIIANTYLSRILYTKNNEFGFRSIFRYLFYVMYLIVTFSIYYVVPVVSEFLVNLYKTNNLSPQNLNLINIIASIIPFPFTTGYAISYLFIGKQIPSYLILFTFLGILFLIMFTYISIRKGGKKILEITGEKSKTTHKTSKSTKIVINVNTPKIAYLKTTLLIVLRDMQSFFKFLIAIIISILPIIQGPIGQDATNQNVQTNVFMSFLYYSPIIIYLLDSAFSTSEENLGGVLSSLPFKNRDMYRVKQFLLYFSLLIAFVLETIVTSAKHTTIYNVLLIIFLFYIFSDLYLVFKALLFGKINKQYTLYSVNQENKYLKWIGLYILALAFLEIESGLIFITKRFYPGNNGYLIFSIINIGAILVLEIINRLVFRN